MILIHPRSTRKCGRWSCLPLCGTDAGRSTLFADDLHPLDGGAGDAAAGGLVRGIGGATGEKDETTVAANVPGWWTDP